MSETERRCATCQWWNKYWTSKIDGAEVGACSEYSEDMFGHDGDLCEKWVPK